MQPIIQCVPNFSEGRDSEVVESIVRAAGRASPVRITDYSSDPDHNRLVVTLLGGPADVRQAVLAAARQAVELIDLRRHTGAHPRIGALDVVPLVPVRGITMHECVELSYDIGKDISEGLGLPVYFYERSAIKSHRVNLADIRRGGYEHLVEEGELTDDHTPDMGPHEAHLTAGATVVGARGPLVAYNINLDTPDLEVSRAIVKKMRSGEARLEDVKSMSVWLASRGKVQVSMNVTRPDITPLRDVYRYVQAEARNLGVEVAESEIIGLIPRRFLDGTSPEELKAAGFKDSQILDNWL